MKQLIVTLNSNYYVNNLDLLWGMWRKGWMNDDEMIHRSIEILKGLV